MDEGMESNRRECVTYGGWSAKGNYARHVRRSGGRCRDGSGIEWWGGRRGDKRPPMHALLHVLKGVYERGLVEYRVVERRCSSLNVETPQKLPGVGSGLRVKVLTTASWSKIF